MDLRVGKLWGAWLLAVLALLIAAPASASSPLQSTCHAYSDEILSPQQAIASLDWTCTDEGWRGDRKVSWLRFDNWDQDEAPVVFSSRIAVFEQATISAIDRGGAVRQQTLSMSEARPLMSGPTFSLPLPVIGPETRSIIVAIEGAHSVTIASEAEILDNAEAPEGTLAQILLLAMIAGMLVMPLLFDGLFFMVLRERFVLLHAGMTISMIAYVLSSGGVITAFISLPISLLAIVGPMAWAFGIGLGGHFIVAFVERDAMTPTIRKQMSICAWWTMIVPGFCALQLPITQSFDNSLYFYAFAPVIPFYMFALLSAVVRGSRAARFLAVAWLPIVLASVDRLLRGIGIYSATDSIDQALFLAIALEVIIVALCVADRFVTLRQERDLARNEARVFEKLTERDPLTNLLNRRAIKGRFGKLRKEGFTTLAIIDLDQFKSINDKYGHNLGDKVLEAVAKALQPDDDTLVVRIGGEEFALLLRGNNTIARAENRRQAIAPIVSANVQLDRIVTASMGVIDAPMEAMPDADFETLYRRADQLLYEAKAAGRNRSMSETLQTFSVRGRDRRKKGNRRAA